MISLLHKNQVYRGLLPRVLSHLILRLLIEQVEELVKNLAELEVAVQKNIVFLRSSLRHLEGKCEVLLSILVVSISVHDRLLHF